MNRDTIAYRRFLGWWWPGDGPAHHASRTSRSPRARRPDTWGIGSPYLRLWLIAAGSIASVVFAGVGAYAAREEPARIGGIVWSLAFYAVWTLVNVGMWMALASRRYGFRIAAPVCALFFGIGFFYFTGYWFPFTVVLFLSPIFTRTAPRDAHARSIAKWTLAVCLTLPTVSTVVYLVGTTFG